MQETKNNYLSETNNSMNTPTEAEKIELLKKVDAFQGLRELDLAGLASKANIINLKENEVLFNEGDKAHSLFIVHKGTVSIFKGSREIIRFGPGDMIGEMSLLDSGTRSATAKVRENSALLEISEDVFQSLLGNQNFTLLKILKVLSKRIRESDQKLAIDHMIMTTLIHDLNNSLTCFSAASMIYKMAEPGSSIQKYAELMMTGQQSIQSMVQEALQSYRTNQIITSKHDLNIIQTINDTVQIHLVNHPEIKKIKLDISLPEKSEKTPHNSNDIIRVLVNLLINAAQASQAENPVKLSLEFVPGFCEIKVKDQGCGIPDRMKTSIFRPGFTSKPKGNGLGLFSCQNIIEKMHGGQIYFVSDEGKGTEFTIRLPTA